MFSPMAHSIDDAGNVIHVIDGGFLLHRVVWYQQKAFHHILSKFVQYVQKYYKVNSIVVFDGYPNDANNKSTKAAECLRRSQRHIAANVMFDETMTATMSQEKFLANDQSKSRLIYMLVGKLQAVGFLVKQAAEDADTIIIIAAIELSPDYDSIVVVGEDVDLLILLISLASSLCNVYLLKPGKGKTESRIYSTKSFKYPEEVAEHILFLHAFCGCDTTAAFFRQGKQKFVKLLKKNMNLRKTIGIFKDPDSSPDLVEAVGKSVIKALYGAGDDHISLN